jgi:hypothetical protein
VQIGNLGTRIAGTFAGVFGLVALTLAAVGVYGVISYTTRQRTPELAIRLAFGAQPRQVFRLVLGQGLRLALLGISIGLVISAFLTRFLKDLLFGVTTTNLLTFSSVCVRLCSVAWWRVSSRRGGLPRSIPWQPCGRNKVPIKGLALPRMRLYLNVTPRRTLLCRPSPISKLATCRLR